MMKKKVKAVKAVKKDHSGHLLESVRFCHDEIRKIVDKDYYFKIDPKFTGLMRALDKLILSLRKVEEKS